MGDALDIRVWVAMLRRRWRVALPAPCKRTDGVPRDMKTLKLVLLPLALLAAGCPSTYQRTVRDYMWTNPQAESSATWQYDATRGIYVHRASGFLFPDKLGEFTRHKLTTYDAAGRNVSAGYDIIGNISVTLYVYPVLHEDGQGVADPTALLGKHAQAVVNDVLKHHAGATVQSEGHSELAAGTNSLPGRVVLFRYEDMGVPLGSALHLYLWGDYFVKFRTTYRPQEEEYSLAELMKLMKAMTWPDRIGGE